jgi:predicted phage terminase large subunit-like protein
MESARRRTQEQWEAIKNGKSARIWNALYQGRPSPDSGDILERGWFKRYTEPVWTRNPDTGAYTVPGHYTVTASYDFTFKNAATSDFVVGQVWAHRGATAYLVDQVRKRLTFTESLATMREMKAKWPQTTAILVEDKANGTAIIDTLKSEIPGIIAVTPKESKVARARAVAPYLEAGNVFLPVSGEPGYGLFNPDDLIEEAVSFPNGRNDDQVDAMSQALQRIFKHGSANGAAAWLESLAIHCEKCGMPNDKVPGPRSCTKCGEPLPEWTPEPEPEATEPVEDGDQKFDLASFVADRPMGPRERDAMEAVERYGPKVWAPFQSMWRR